jgi:Uma2 family endonuclease
MATLTTYAETIYPDSDGERMSDNTVQFDWIVSIKLNVEDVFADRADVFVAGDLLWYPVEGDPKTRIAPDTMVAFGRPKGHRASYQQWREAGVAPQVVFEVLSPGNIHLEMVRKQGLYDRFGVEEYYVIDPDHGEAAGWLRTEGKLQALPEIDGWTSPRLGIRFQVDAQGVHLFRPDGSPFRSYAELAERAEAARRRADAESQRADAESQRAEVAEREARLARERAARLEQRLKALGVDPGE